MWDFFSAQIWGKKKKKKCSENSYFSYVKELQILENQIPDSEAAQNWWN